MKKYKYFTPYKIMVLETLKKHFAGEITKQEAIKIIETEFIEFEKGREVSDKFKSTIANTVKEQDLKIIIEFLIELKLKSTTQSRARVIDFWQYLGRLPNDYI